MKRIWFDVKISKGQKIKISEKRDFTYRLHLFFSLFIFVNFISFYTLTLSQIEFIRISWCIILFNEKINLSVGVIFTIFSYISFPRNHLETFRITPVIYIRSRKLSLLWSTERKTARNRSDARIVLERRSSIMLTFANGRPIGRMKTRFVLIKDLR